MQRSPDVAPRAIPGPGGGRLGDFRWRAEALIPDEAIEGGAAGADHDSAPALNEGTGLGARLMSMVDGRGCAPAAVLASAPTMSTDARRMVISAPTSLPWIMAVSGRGFFAHLTAALS